MNFRVTDMLDTDQPLPSDESVEIEFAEFAGTKDSNSESLGESSEISNAPTADNAQEAEVQEEERDLSSSPSAEAPDWFRSVRKIHLHDAGVQFRLTIRNGETKADVSGVQSKLMTFVRPDGAAFDREARFFSDGSDGIICYTTSGSDLAAVGEWQVQATVDFGDEEFRSEIHSFTVHEPEESRTQDAPLIETDSPRKLSRRKAILEEIRRRKRNAIHLGIDTDLNDEEPPKNWREWLIRWLKSPESRSLATSMAFHATLLIILSLILFSNLRENQAISMTMSDENSLPVEFQEVDLALSDAGGEQKTAPQFQKVERQELDKSMQEQLDELLRPSGQGNGEELGDEGFGLTFKMPTGGQVVRKGSFAAWTVPKDPRPNEDYDIVIQIQLPKERTRYPISDLSGRVVGTDDYTLSIPYEIQFNRYGTKIQRTRNGPLVFAKKRDNVFVVDNQVQVIVHVEGAKQLVQDRIEVRSRMLKEEQNLRIQF